MKGLKDMKKNYMQLFAAPTNTTISTDLEPAISIDFTSRISRNIAELQKVLGISELVPLSAGTNINIYKMKASNTPDQVGEGETIPLTEFTNKPVVTKTLTLSKYRKNTTAEAIQRVGRELAVNKTDEEMVTIVQKAVKSAFYTALATGTGTATGVGLQAALANTWAKIQAYYEDMDVNSVFFVNPTDVATYLGSASITMQTAFGFNYVENFLGLGTAIVTPKVTAGTLFGTAKENLNGAYAPVSGDLGQAFGLTSDSTGLVGMTHQIVGANASIDTLLMSGVVFYPEFADGIFKGTITAQV